MKGYAIISAALISWFVLVPADPTRNYLVELQHIPGTGAGSLERRDSALGLLRGLGADFAVAVTIGRQAYNFIIDTGSYYTWVVTEGFSCHEQSGSPVPPSDCGYAKALSYTPEIYAPTGSVFSASYTDGDGASGQNGLANIGLSGLKVKQQVGLVNNVTRAQVPDTSGVLGLSLPPPGLPQAFPSVSSAIVDNIFSQNLSKPTFQLALVRRTSSQSRFGGLLNFGSWPRVADELIRVRGLTATTPLLNDTNFYNITIDAVTVDGKDLSSSGPEKLRHYIVDCGTLLTYLPEPVAAQLNSQLHSSVYRKNDTWLIDCDAAQHMISTVGFRIGGQTFIMDAADMIYEVQTGVCVTSFQTLAGTGGYFNILGQQFLKNVWVEFDWGGGLVRMRGRA